MKKLKVFEPWIGEFGWELMTWQAQCRKIARDYDYTIVTSYPECKALYADFATEFLSHDKRTRSLDFPKQYRVDGEWIKYGKPKKICDVLFHARGVQRGAFKNYKRWEIVSRETKNSNIKTGFIGSKDDGCFDADIDLRGIELSELMDVIAGAKVVVGASSGVMHLAMLCGTPVVVWSDNRTYFGETLIKRYKSTWNPLDTDCHFIISDDWQPEPETIFKGLTEFL